MLHRWLLGIGLGSVFALGGCQLSPTNVVETRKFRSSEDASGNLESVLIDPRSAFEFASSRVPGSISLRWEDLVGPPVSDVGARLALLGIDPQVPVEVLVSPGDRGGRDVAVAWAMAWLGIRKIKLRSIQGLKLSALPEEAARANRKRFRPELNLDWVADGRELNTSERGFGGVRVIDVRTPKEYFARKKSGEFRTPDERVVNIPWREFFDDRGLPRREMIRQLQATGFKRDQRLLVISERGRRSAAVTFALRELGFTRAANVLVGWRGVLDAQESGG